VRILATSQEGLGVPGETLWRVPSLSLPDVHGLPPPKDLVLYEAVRLFVDRAMATAPGFAVTSQNAPVAQVCQQLDGIPLAIELAAARVKVLAVEQIAARLDDRFRLLTGGSRMALPRQQTLRGAIDWSYNLLSEAERGLLQRLSVFAGGWTLEAAEAICGGKGIEAPDVSSAVAAGATRGLPHWPQNRIAGGFSKPQAGQRTLSRPDVRFVQARTRWPPPVSSLGPRPRPS
jgi:predicted ATPase